MDNRDGLGWREEDLGMKEPGMKTQEINKQTLEGPGTGGQVTENPGTEEAVFEGMKRGEYVAEEPETEELVIEDLNIEELDIEELDAEELDIEDLDLEELNRENLNRSGRGGRFNTTWLLAGILAVLLTAAAVIYMNQTSGTGGRTNGAGSELSERPNGGEPGNEDAGGTGAENGESAGGESAEGGTGAAASLPSGAGENGAETEAETVTEPETEETTEAAPVQLESLSGLAPGTILEPEQIDFDDLSRYFMSWKIEEGDNLYDRINGKSYRANNHVPLSSLRYLKMPHYNFKGQIQVGEMIVNKDIQEDVFSIFTELFKAKYQIQSMYLVDNYWTGDAETSDSASIDDNNTSAFCYREISGGGNLSNHAYGRAIDLNPQQNPYVSYSSGLPRWSHSNANDYIARDTGLPHVITHEDLAYKLFTKRGFRWGGDWNTPKDYQHFDKNNK